MIAVLLAVAIVAPIAFSYGFARGVNRMLDAIGDAAKREALKRKPPRLDIGPALQRAFREQRARRA